MVKDGNVSRHISAVRRHRGNDRLPVVSHLVPRTIAQNITGRVSVPLSHHTRFLFGLSESVHTGADASGAALKAITSDDVANELWRTDRTGPRRLLEKNNLPT